MKDRNHLSFSPVSSLEAGSCPSEADVGEAAGLRRCAEGLARVSEVPRSRTCCSHLRDVWHSQHPSPGLAPGTSPLPKCPFSAALGGQAGVAAGSRQSRAAAVQELRRSSRPRPSDCCSSCLTCLGPTAEGFGTSLPWRLISFKSLIW